MKLAQRLLHPTHVIVTHKPAEGVWERIEHDVHGMILRERRAEPFQLLGVAHHLKHVSRHRTAHSHPTGNKSNQHVVTFDSQLLSEQIRELLHNLVRGHVLEPPLQFGIHDRDQESPNVQLVCQVRLHRDVSRVLNHDGWGGSCGRLLHYELRRHFLALR